jgi:uncharacterized protein
VSRPHSTNRRQNRLAGESSPYLRQHADNPVDWWPWNAQALDAARTQDKPILLSIGYSACHWCHVMAHESFEDEATAQTMNEKFICIKVDREERPDLDKIYQLAHQVLTRRGGGWPLTMFLAPDDLAPFYAGTYFPKEARYGMPPFAYVLDQVRDFWDQRRDDVRTQNASLREFLDQQGKDEVRSDALDDAPINAALAQIEQNFDHRYGGHLGAPKFPHCAEMELLLDLNSQDALEMVELTLLRIAEGGIHDQIGGGFCRYSVDERWEIPHFEKMLYDNAQLLPLYASHARSADGKRRRPIVQTTLEWLAREMIAPSGGFYAARDADSEGHEGKFYVWQRDEVRALLDDAEFAIVERRYGFDREPNFENTAWNPIVAASIDRVAAALGVSAIEVESTLGRARAKLFGARGERVKPALDTKILTAWNALMIGGLARASRELDSTTYAQLAENALDSLRKNAWLDGVLYASFDGDRARFRAYLDDYAFLLDALLETLQCDWSNRCLDWAVAVADALLERFEDRERGGFYFTANDHETLIQRPKPFADEAIPSGNGIAARALLRLGHLLGETRYLDAAEGTLRAAFSSMQQMPQACATLQRALNDFLHPRTLIVVRFDSLRERSIWRLALTGHAPHRSDVYFVPEYAGMLPGTLGAQTYTAGGVAYLCRGTQCDAPITDIDRLRAALGAA